jgi:hypothetical protein
MTKELQNDEIRVIRVIRYVVTSGLRFNASTISWPAVASAKAAM